jgi:hypothetical protein
MLFVVATNAIATVAADAAAVIVDATALVGVVALVLRMRSTTN